MMIILTVGETPKLGTDTVSNNALYVKKWFGHMRLTIPVSHFVDNDNLGKDYNASFMDEIFLMEIRKIDNDDSVEILQATNLICDQTMTTPSTNYSPLNY